MPVIDGRKFYREVERRHPALRPRVIFITADVLSLETPEFLERTGAPSLTKPFTLEELQRALRRVLGAE